MNITMNYDINALCEKLREKVSKGIEMYSGSVSIDIVTAKEILDVLEELQVREAKYLYEEFTKRGIKLKPRQNIKYYIDKAIEQIDVLSEISKNKIEMSAESRNKMSKLEKENEILRKCVPGCIGGCDNELIDCNMCQYCEQCEELTNA